MSLFLHGSLELHWVTEVSSSLMLIESTAHNQAREKTAVIHHWDELLFAECLQAVWHRGSGRAMQTRQKTKVAQRIIQQG